MPSARQVKQRITTAQNIAKITKAMEMTSASKMKRAQQSALSARPYAKALEESLRLVAAQNPEYSHPLLSRHETGVNVLILVSTDRGLCGSLNQNLFKMTATWLTSNKDGQIIAVGKKAVAFAKYLGLDVLATFIDMPDHIQAADLVGLSALILDRFSRHELKTVDLLFADFINTLSQQPKIIELLPISHLPSESETLSTIEKPSEFLFEPSPKDILDELLPYYLENTIFQTFLEAKASEHSSRMVAMKNASENAQDLVKELRLVYNKTRQESITNELLEITTATVSLQA